MRFRSWKISKCHGIFSSSLLFTYRLRFLGRREKTRVPHSHYQLPPCRTSRTPNSYRGRICVINSSKKNVGGECCESVVKGYVICQLISAPACYGFIRSPCFGMLIIIECWLLNYIFFISHPKVAKNLIFFITLFFEENNFHSISNSNSVTHPPEYIRMNSDHITPSDISFFLSDNIIFTGQETR